MMAHLYALLCAALALRLLMFRRDGSRHRPMAATAAYFLIIAAASVPIRLLFGVPVPTDPAALVLLAIVCMASFAVRGNVAELFRQAGKNDKPQGDSP